MGRQEDKKATKAPATTDFSQLSSNHVGHTTLQGIISNTKAHNASIEMSRSVDQEALDQYISRDQTSAFREDFTSNVNPQ